MIVLISSYYFFIPFDLFNIISSVYTAKLNTGEKAKADRETKWRQINETKAINKEVTKINIGSNANKHNK